MNHEMSNYIIKYIKSGLFLRGFENGSDAYTYIYFSTKNDTMKWVLLSDRTAVLSSFLEII